MSDLNQPQGQNLSLIADIPPTQPQDFPEAPTLQTVKDEAGIFLLCFGHEAVRELYAHFGAESADDLTETDWGEFIRLAKMSCKDRAEVLGSKRTAPPPSAVELNGTTTITMREKAVALAKMGFRVFPLKAGTKDILIYPHNKPKPPKREYHKHIPSSDPGDVAAMWTGANDKALNYNIGINTDDLLVIDVDNKSGKSGDLSLLQLVMENGLEVTTVEARTPTGGRHLFYKLPEGLSVRNTASKLASGIDTRGHHGFVVAAGSVVPKGEYQWVRAPGAVAMADAPEWIVRACAASDRPEREATTVDGLELDAPEAIDRAIAWLEKDAPEAVENNGGNTATFRVAATVKDMGISEETCFDLLVEHWNDEKALPPWSVGELEQIVGNAYVYGKQPIGVASATAQFEAVGIGEGVGAAAPPVATDDDAPSDRPPDSKPEPPLPFISAAAWHGLPIPEREWVLRDRIPMRNVTLLAGDGGVGKTILHLQAGTAIVLGREWLGIPTEPGPVAVVCCEDDADELHRRVALIANHYQVELSDLKDLHLLPLVDGHDTVLALTDSNGQIRPTKMFAQLREAVCDIRPRLLTIDNLADVYGGNEINRVQVRQFITLLRNLAVAAGGATLLTAHPSLTGMASGSGTSGSTGWHNSARARMYMTHPKAEGGVEPDRDLRVLKTMKSNYGPPSEEIKLQWSNGVWAPIHTGIDRAAVAQDAERKFLALLERFTREGRNVSHKPGPSYAPTLFAREAEVGPVGVTRKDLEAAMSRLFAGGKIRVENYGRPSRPYSRLILVVAPD